jgi:hypothetical protein
LADESAAGEDAVAVPADVSGSGDLSEEGAGGVVDLRKVFGSRA